MTNQTERPNVTREKKEPSSQKLEALIRAIANLSIEVPDPKHEGKSVSIAFSEKELREAYWPPGKRFRAETLRRIIPQYFRENILNFGIDPIQWKRIVLTRTQLLSERPERLLSNIVTTALAVGVSPITYLKAATRNPQLFYRSPDSILRHIKTSVQLFGVDQDLLTKKFISHPQVFSFAPETMHNHVSEAAKRIGVAQQDYLFLALQNPFLFRYHPDRIQYNVEEGAKLLGVENTTYVEMAKKSAGLFKQAPVTTQNKSELYQIFSGKNKSEVIQAFVVNPRLLTVAPERIFAHYAIAKLRNEKEILLSWHILKANPLKYAKNKLSADEYSRFRSAFQYLVHLSEKRRTMRRRMDPQKETSAYWEHADFIDRYFGKASVRLDDAARLNIQKLFDTVIMHVEKRKQGSSDSES